jgi:hypothetical protein
MRRAWVVGASVLLLAGCAGGSDSGSSPDAASPAGQAPGGAGMAAYAQCMSEHGVELPAGGPVGGVRPSVAPSGMPTDAPSAALAACSALAPTGGPGQPGGAAPTASGGASQFAVFWSCMSDHDVTAPTSGLPTDLDKGDATVAAALTICDALLPASATG